MDYRDAALYQSIALLKHLNLIIESHKTEQYKSKKVYEIAAQFFESMNQKLNAEISKLEADQDL